MSEESDASRAAKEDQPSPQVSAKKEHKPAPNQPHSNRSNSSRSSVDEASSNKPGIQGGKGEDPLKSNLVYGAQIIRGLVIFIVGCVMTCDLIGLRLYRCLEEGGYPSATF